MRQIVLDTETTGLEVSQGHRIIEIGGVELIDRKLTGRHFHQYINPHREIDAGAMEVHGITNEYLADKPSFADIADQFLEFIRGAELIIHNAPFDISFMDTEFQLVSSKYPRTRDVCSVVDTVVMARKKHPGQKNNLDALCKRYGVDNSQRDLHGALLDAEILADVYLAMTGGQTALSLGGTDAPTNNQEKLEIQTISLDRKPLRVIKACPEEQAAHEEQLQKIKKASGACLWLDIS
ncbi:MAG: DNA polymerase III subunit epsilon [Pseudomonadales bacterium]|nr:DNA polymerase III subunit epsilon [Pseudomonadales bacterium]